MVEVSRDGRRVYLTNSLYVPWDAQFYPDGIQGWMVKLDADPAGGMSLDPNFFLDFGDQRPHQVRLQGGDASTDSYCFRNSATGLARRLSSRQARRRPRIGRDSAEKGGPHAGDDNSWPWISLAAWAPSTA